MASEASKRRSQPLKVDDGFQRSKRSADGRNELWLQVLRMRFVLLSFEQVPLLLSLMLSLLML